MRGTRPPGPSESEGCEDRPRRAPEPSELEREDDTVSRLSSGAGESLAAVVLCCIRRPLARPTVIVVPGTHVDNKLETNPLLVGTAV